MENILMYENNFNKNKSKKSQLLYGNMIENADFTLVIPVYGCNKRLGELIDNIRLQRQCKLMVQVIVSDNKKYKANETMGREIIRLLENSKIKNIAYFLSDEPLGQLGNFNRCGELCKTEYFGMVHDDDLLVENYFFLVERILQFMKNNPWIGEMHQASMMFYGDACFEKVASEKIVATKITRLKIDVTGYSQTGVPSCGTIFKKEAFVKAGGFNDKYPSSGDAFLSAIMMDMGYSIWQLKTISGYYRIEANGSLKTDLCKRFIIEDEMFRNAWQAKKAVRKYIMKPLRNYCYSKDILGKVKAFGKLNQEITVDALDYKKEYRAYRKWDGVALLYHIWQVLYKIPEIILSKHIK